jgi:flavin-dependent dehydrogenase
MSNFSAIIPLIKDPNFYKIPCAGENWILIGDAAGHVDPITGEGILYAMWGAELAAKTITNHNIQEFDTLWRKEYGYDLLEGCKMKDMFYNSTMIELSVILASRSKTFSNLLYDITSSEEDYRTFNSRMLGEFPKSLIEFIFKL